MSDRGPRLIDRHWYVPVEDLHEALNALEHYYLNLPGSSAEAVRVLKENHRIGKERR